MHKAGGLILLLLMIFPVLLFAQDDDDGGWDTYYDDAFVRGDQTFIFSLGVIFPTVSYSNGSVRESKISPPVGGTGSISYNYYLFQNFFVGAEISGMFLPTLSGETLYLLPIGARAGYQFNVWRLEFPLNFTFGMVWHRYLNLRHYSIYMKGGGAAFFRALPTWSFGINVDWYWFPEWTGDKSTDFHEHFLDLTLSARYHL